MPAAARAARFGRDSHPNGRSEHEVLSSDRRRRRADRAVAIVAIAAPASGVSTSKLSKQVKALKKQVAAIQKQQGPAGPPGQNGAAGTARAYATITPSCTGSGPEICTFVKSKGITAVERTGVNYCVRAPGIDPATTSAVVGVDWDSTASPEDEAQVLTGGAAPDCAAGFKARTERVDGSSAANVGFTILIP
ncbi:MAG: hypothetical protein ACXWZ3_07555 [Solirubrobacterales bacterium]